MSRELDEDWEEWNPSKGNFYHHMAAGSIAGMVEHLSIFPIDTVKTHLQCESCPNNELPSGRRLSAIDTARYLIEKNGVRRLFRGVSTMLGASIPAHAAYFSIFESCKKTFGADGPHHAPIASGLAGVFATMGHDCIMTPMDVIKQRLQLGYYSGVVDCFTSIVRQEGFSALYLSFSTTLLMNLPYGMVMVATNETIKKILNPSNESNISAYLIAGGASGALAGVVTNPLDVAKTRLQTQLALQQPMSCNLKTSSTGVILEMPSTCALTKQTTLPQPQFMHQYNGLIDALKKIKASEGYRGFFRGVGPRLLVQAPSVAVSWTTYEVVKQFLHDLDA